MSFLDWLFPGRNDLPSGPGMVVVNNTPPKTVDQIRAEENALPPRSWDLVEGHGWPLGVAVEDKDTGRIKVTWHPDLYPKLKGARTDWVDEKAFRADMGNNSVGGFLSLHGVTLPSRIRYRPRNDREKHEQDMIESFDW